MGTTGTIGLLWRFFVHLLCGTVLFAGVGAPALALGFLVNQAVEWGLPEFMIVVISALEYLVFCVDAVLYALFVSVEGCQLGREIWHRRHTSL